MFAGFVDFEFSIWASGKVLLLTLVLNVSAANAASKQDLYGEFAREHLVVAP